MRQILFFLALFIFSASLFAQAGNGLSSKQLKAIEAVMAPLRLQVEAQLKKSDPKLYSGYQGELKQLMAITDAKKQKAALGTFQTKYYAFVKKGYAAAKIDEKSAQANISAILKGSKYAIRFTEFMGITGTLTPPPPATTPSKSCVEFNCPFEVRNTTMSANLNGQGFTSGNCGARASNVGMLASGREDLSALGEFTTIQAGMTRVDVSAQLDYNVNGFAGACIGGSYADASVGFLIKGPGVDKRIEHVSGWAVAPLVWYNAFEKTGENDRMQGDFRPATGGGEYKVQLFAKSFTMCAVVAMSLGSANVEEIDYLKVCQTK